MNTARKTSQGCLNAGDNILQMCMERAVIIPVPVFNMRTSFLKMLRSIFFRKNTDDNVRLRWQKRREVEFLQTIEKINH